MVKRMSESKKEELVAQPCCNQNGEEACECELTHDKKGDDLVNDEQLKLVAEIACLNDQLLRNKAELENFKKRMNDERIKDNKYRSQALATAILPALDTFERAMLATTDNEEVKNFLAGFEMVHKQFVESLASEGVELIESEGQPFDPNFHQAVMQEAVEGADAGIVLVQMQKGYKLKDRVIRPAMVKVSQ